MWIHIWREGESALEEEDKPVNLSKHQKKLSQSALLVVFFYAPTKRGKLLQMKAVYSFLPTHTQSAKQAGEQLHQLVLIIEKDPAAYISTSSESGDQNEREGKCNLPIFSKSPYFLSTQKLSSEIYCAGAINNIKSYKAFWSFF